jgi:hypothetical protein
VPTFFEDQRWVNNVTGEPALHIPPSETVYAVWIGTNDLGNAGYLTETQQPSSLPLTHKTDCVFSQLDELYDVAGARSFVIMNMVPLELSPQYGLPGQGGVEVPYFWWDKMSYNDNMTQISEKMRQYSTMVNAVYDLQVPYLVKLTERYPDSAFAVFDVHSLVSEPRRSPL